jgi:hypothetical protein
LLAMLVVLLLRRERPDKRYLGLGVVSPTVNTPREATPPNSSCHDHDKTVIAPTPHPQACSKRLRQENVMHHVAFRVATNNVNVLVDKI